MSEDSSGWGSRDAGSGFTQSVVATMSFVSALP